jgi:RNA polymerase sigma factor (sigma-70 family)
MARRPWEPVLEHIRALAAARPDARTCDAELLSRFVGQRDEAAFESLLRRHGPMVLRVARRVLDNDTDAEDVFQAAFLLLARRASAIRKRESVASWLHSVAHRLAVSTRSKRKKRQATERRAAKARPTETPSAWSELEATLHEVLAQLPEKYRTPLVYCYLEGWTQEEVARDLGVPLGTLRSWVARGRELLRKRLFRRGIAFSAAGASSALLASACAPAEAVPIALRMTTLQAARLFVAGGNVMTLISPQVAMLVRRGMTAFLVAKLKGGAACFLALVLLVVGSGWAAHRTFGAKPPERNEAAEKAPPKEAAPEAHPRVDVYGDPLPPGAVARLGTIRFRHEQWAFWQFAISPDGHTIATAGRSLILWDMATGRPLRRFPLIQGIRSLAFAPDGKSVAVGGVDYSVRRIDLASGKELLRFVGHQPDHKILSPDQGVFGVAFTTDGKKLVTWGSDGTVRVWEARSGKELRKFGGKDFGSADWHIWSLSPDGKLLAVSDQESFHLWNLETGKEVRQLRTKPYGDRTVAFSPDGKIFGVSEAGSDRPGRIVLWDMDGGKERAASASQKGPVTALAFSPDGKTLASAGFGRSRFGLRIHLWDVASMKELRAISLSEKDGYYSVTQLAFSPDGETLISRGHENHIRLWDVASGKERKPAEGPSYAIHDLAYSPNAKLVAAASANRIWLWSATTGKLVRMLESTGPEVRTVAFSADGKSLVSASQDRVWRGDITLQLWDSETGKEQHRIRMKGDSVRQMKLAPDAKTLAVSNFGDAVSSNSSNPQLIVLWDTRTGEKRRSIRVLPATSGEGILLDGLYFSSDGKTLFSVGGKEYARILRWDTTSGKELPIIGEHDSPATGGIAFSPDGRSIAALSQNRTLYFWETATGQARLVIKNAGFASSIAISPDGSLLALVNSGYYGGYGNNDKNRDQVRLVRVADGKIIRRFTGHRGGINRVRFSPDGRTLASGGQDTTVLLWDVMKARKDAVKETAPFKPEKLAGLWKGLRGTAAEAHGCMCMLISAPGHAVPFLSEKLKPIVAVDAERFARLLKKLESDSFAEREKATQELKKLSDALEPALRKALQEKPPLETRRRLQALLDDLDWAERLRSLDGAERLRSLRAIEVLERIGDKPARDLLRRLSKGAAGAWLTEEARTSLQRLK